MDNLKTIKEKLEKEKEELEKQIKTLGVPPELGDDPGEDDEEADETEEFGNQIGVQQTLRNKLEGINSALRKIEENKYGICEFCGKKIAGTLLEIEPTSKLCQECKKEGAKK